MPLLGQVLLARQGSVCIYLVGTELSISAMETLREALAASSADALSEGQVAMDRKVEEMLVQMGVMQGGAETPAACLTKLVGAHTALRIWWD